MITHIPEAHFNPVYSELSSNALQQSNNRLSPIASALCGRYNKSVISVDSAGDTDDKKNGITEE